MPRVRDVTVGQLETLAVALYVRDALGLRPLVLSPIPALEPAVEVRVDAAEHAPAERLAREWDRWWVDLLAVLAARRGMADLALWGGDQDRVLARQPSLHAAAAALLDEAARWATQRRTEFAAQRGPRQVRTAHGYIELPERRALDRATRWRWWRRDLPRSVRITVLPVAGAQGWVVAPGLFLVSAGLALEGGDRYGDWLLAAVLGRG